MQPEALSFTSSAQDAGARLDKWLADAAGEALTRSRIKQLLLAGCVENASGEALTNPSMKVPEGLAVSIRIPPAEPMDLTPNPMDLEIIYEDEALIVISKPVGLSVHPAAGTGNHTLVHGLLHHCGESLSGIGGVMRPGIVHRIDKDTSGLLVVAKTDQAHQYLADQLQKRTLKRTYLAWAWGEITPAAGKIDAPIARHPVHRKKMAVVENGRHAVTHYTTRYCARLDGGLAVATALQVKLETGRTHQIRVHFQHIGKSLVGDQTYGASTQTRLNRLRANKNADFLKPVEPCLSGLGRQALHAAELALIHPLSHKEMTFQAPLPPDLQRLEDGLLSLT
jgi:23S rRNA pseudouridine1911/1915/1917 synthase